MMAVTLDAVSKAADKGYGNFTFEIRTDPAAPVGTAYALVPNSGAGTVRGTLDAAGAALVDSVRRISAGAKTATVTVTGHGEASAPWTMEALAWETFTQDRRTLAVTGKWCVSGGAPGTTTADAELDWGDGTPKQVGTMTAPGWTTGLLPFGIHRYAQTLTDRTYTVKLTSGAQSVQRTITVPGTGRPILRAFGSDTGAVADVWEWAEREFVRSTSVLAIVGSRDPVVLLDELRRPSSTLTLLTRTQGEAWVMLQTLYLREPLQLLTPCADVPTVWLVVLGVTERRVTNSSSDHRRGWDLQVQEVKAP
ncbi:hypothetical protein [Streptomyces sp. NPDC059247]|uniref:hypothetical protein n=1 Tax=Streptomyces sp. NPDC059247 TaxID=3346790 RepID=UPI0036CB34E8